MEAPHMRGGKVNIMKLEECRRLGYGQLAYYAMQAIKSEGRLRYEYLSNFGAALCTLSTIRVLDEDDFMLLIELRYKDLTACFNYVNDKAGNWYEI